MKSPSYQSTPWGSTFEEFCRRAVSALLEKEGQTSYRWRKGAEPPDYFLEVNGMTIAVEMTSIHGSGEVGGEQLPWPEIEAVAAKKVRPMLRGLEVTYPNAGVHVVTLEPFPNTSDHLPEIKAGLRQYLEMNKELTKTEGERTIWRHGPARITARRVKLGATRFSTPLYLNEGRVGPLSDRIGEILGHAVRRKIDKLKGVEDPKALVILDRHLSCDLSTWREELPSESSTFFFVARVQSEVAEWVLPPRWQ